MTRIRRPNLEMINGKSVKSNIIIAYQHSQITNSSSERKNMYKDIKGTKKVNLFCHVKNEKPHHYYNFVVPCYCHYHKLRL